mgnify:CR=1 FL=1
MLEKNGTYLSSFVGNFNMENDFYSAIINPQNSNEVLLAGGTYAGCYFNDYSVFEEKEYANQQLRSAECDKEILRSTQYNNANNNNQNIPCHSERSEESEQPCPNCATCKYKEFFYSNFKDNKHAETNKDYLVGTGNNVTECHTTLATTTLQDENEIFSTTECNKEILRSAQYNNGVCHSERIPCHSERSEESQGYFASLSMTKNECQGNINQQREIPKSLIEQLIPQFNYIFENYPPNSELNNLVMGGKFVQINENGENYSLGAIYENNQMKYICYALKCSYNTPPPKELGKHHQWLPLDVADPLTDGYYLVFQDAHDLKIVEM